jgi:hypothetical protein
MACAMVANRGGLHRREFPPQDCFLRDGRKQGWSATSGVSIDTPSILRIGRKRGWSAPKWIAGDPFQILRLGRKRGWSATKGLDVETFRTLRLGRKRGWSAPSRQRNKKPLPHQWEGRVTLSAISLLRCVKGPLLAKGRKPARAHRARSNAHDYPKTNATNPPEFVASPRS